MYYLKIQKCVFTLFCVLLIGYDVLANGNNENDVLKEDDTISQVSTPAVSQENTSSPTSPATKTPNTATTKTSNTEEKAELEKGEYNIKIYDDQNGVIEQFRTKTKVENVRYSIEPTDQNQWQSKLHIDEISGVLRITEPLIPRDYIFTVRVTVGEKITSTAKVTLQVKRISNPNDKPMFTIAFLKKHIEENKAVEIWAPEKKSTEKCEYFINNQKPQGVFFSLNKDTGELISDSKVDRESEIFKDQVQANIKLDLLIRCASGARKKRFFNVESYQDIEYDLWVKKRQKRRNHFGDSQDKNEKHSTSKPNEEENQCEEKQTLKCDSLLDDRVEYKTDTMKLLVIIDDVNDNPPEFLKKEYFLGYPDKTLFSDIIPENIGRVKAVDKDEGINAAIKYTLKNTQEIIIDPCTGILSPHYNYFKYERLNFEVVATDRNGMTEGQNATVSVTIDILKGYQIMKILVKKTLTENNKDIVIAIEHSLNAKVGILKRSTVPSMYEVSESREINTEGYECLEYFVLYAHRDKQLLDLNKEVDNIKQTKDLKDRIVWTHVMAATPYHLVQTKSFVSTVVVLLLLLSLGSMVFYIMYIRTGKYYRCINYFKRSNTTTPLETNEGSIGTSDYVVSFARMNHVNPTFNVSEAESDMKITKDMFTPVTLKALESSTTNQIINAEELNTTPPILVNINPNSRHNSGGGEDMLGLPSDTRVRRKSSVSFNEIVEQYHTVH